MSQRLILLAAALLCAAALLSACAVQPAAVTDSPAERISQSELLAHLERQDTDVVVLDVRTAAEFAAGHVPGARNLSHDQLQSRLAEVEALRDKQVVLYCRSGRRSQLAAEVLSKAGFTRLRHLEGDFLAWEAGQRPVERAAAEETPAAPKP